MRGSNAAVPAQDQARSDQLRAARSCGRAPYPGCRPQAAWLGLERRSRRDAWPPILLILIDTSAWVEFLRDTGSPVCERVDQLLSSRIATCDAIRMEVLAGARDENHVHQLRRLLARATFLPTESIDFDSAAAIYRTCRSQGTSVRKLIDCLIAAVAIRENVPILHLDHDFAGIASVTSLRTDSVK